MKSCLLVILVSMVTYRTCMTSVPSCYEIDVCKEEQETSLDRYNEGTLKWCNVYKEYFGCVMDVSVNCSATKCELETQLYSTRQLCLNVCDWPELCKAYSVDCSDITTRTTTSSTTSADTTTTTHLDRFASQLNDTESKSDSAIAFLSWNCVTVLALRVVM